MFSRSLDLKNTRPKVLPDSDTDTQYVHYLPFRTYMLPAEIFGMRKSFDSFPGKPEIEGRSESILSLEKYDRRFKLHVSLYVHLFIHR
jgi:hypothetical protein